MSVYLLKLIEGFSITPVDTGIICETRYEYHAIENHFPPRPSIFVRIFLRLVT
jgi:hypothetical protein